MTLERHWRLARGQQLVRAFSEIRSREKPNIDRERIDMSIENKQDDMDRYLEVVQYVPGLSCSDYASALGWDIRRTTLAEKRCASSGLVKVRVVGGRHVMYPTEIRIIA